MHGKTKTERRVKEVVDGKKVTVYDEVEKTIKKDAAEQTSCKKTDAESSLSCKRSSGSRERREVQKKLIWLTSCSTRYAPKYADRNGGYTRIVKIGLRKGDAAMEVLLELV